MPFKKPKKKEQSPKDKLDFYMKNAKNREYYECEIEELIDANPSLEGRYYWHWGRIISRDRKKWMKKLGIKNKHFAIVSDTVIAQGDSEKQVKEVVKAMLPKDKWEWVFYFSI
ncbi:MAG: hypothetical protein AAF741_14535 [Bacteroidota bacterium]